jgi:hypothetical protein
MSDLSSRVRQFIDAGAGLIPAGVRSGASGLGGSVSRGLAAVGNPVASGFEKVGMQKAGQTIRSGVSKTAALQANVLPNYSNLTGSRILGYAGAAAGLGGAFVGGMGAGAGMNALANYYAQDTLSRRSEIGTIGSSAMPQDLQTGYISLNQYGSPLGVMNVGALGGVRQAQLNQRAMRNNSMF